MDLITSIRCIVSEEIDRALRPHLANLLELQNLSGRGATRGRPSVRSRGPGGGRGCAVAGCSREAKSLGYCPTHYQKYRKLKARGLAVQYGWGENQSPGSLENHLLPRGRPSAAKKRAA